MKFVYVTGNEHKAKLFNDMVGLKIEHEKADVEEIQSLDLAEIIEHKAKSAYKKLNKPVIVEDTKLVFNELGKLPGPLIKWFLESIGVEGLCKLLDGRDKSAVAGAAIACFDGENLEIFEKELSGKLSDKPRGKSGFGWNVVFIPTGSDRTLGEMNQAEFKKYYLQIKPFKELRRYLDSQEA
ncbi:non-canonical purine NTP pyrophosphatase [Candidatus Saccharibacteria bacterium]|nr:non-canonical purine NTP pyrophosphatase [Candidatus Saccharibacteria bacterium]